MNGINEEFARLLRRRRHSLGWSVRQLSQTADFPVALIAILERGDIRPTRDTVRRLCKALGLPLIVGIEAAGFVRITPGAEDGGKFPAIE